MKKRPWLRLVGLGLVGLLLASCRPAAVEEQGEVFTRAELEEFVEGLFPGGHFYLTQLYVSYENPQWIFVPEENELHIQLDLLARFQSASKGDEDGKVQPGPPVKGRVVAKVSFVCDSKREGLRLERGDWVEFELPMNPRTAAVIRKIVSMGLTRHLEKKLLRPVAVETEVRQVRVGAEEVRVELGEVVRD